MDTLAAGTLFCLFTEGCAASHGMSVAVSSQELQPAMPFKAPRPRQEKNLGLLLSLLSRQCPSVSVFPVIVLYCLTGPALKILGIAAPSWWVPGLFTGPFSKYLDVQQWSHLEEQTECWM